VRESEVLEAVPVAPVSTRRKKARQRIRRSPDIAAHRAWRLRWHGSLVALHDRNESILTNLLAGDKPIVGAFLHARTFQLLYYFSRPQRGRWMLMCSRSSDGDLMTKVEQGLGYRVARGSSGSGGARALAEMIKAQREDRHLNSCLAVDGSRGPRGIAQLGILTLARKNAGVLLPGPRHRHRSPGCSDLGIDRHSEARRPNSHPDRRAHGIASPNGRAADGIGADRAGKAPDRDAPGSGHANGLHGHTAPAAQPRRLKPYDLQAHTLSGCYRGSTSQE